MGKYYEEKPLKKPRKSCKNNMKSEKKNSKSYTTGTPSKQEKMVRSKNGKKILKRSSLKLLISTLRIISTNLCYLILKKPRKKNFSMQ